jgi:hypothetical protein
MLFYPAALPLSRQALTHVAGIIRRHRAQTGSCHDLTTVRIWGIPRELAASGLVTLVERSDSPNPR